MHEPALQAKRRRAFHAHELPHRPAVGNDGIRKRLIAAKHQRTAQIDRIAGTRYACARNTGTKNECRQ
jgi:hypothetical protein